MHLKDKTKDYEELYESLKYKTKDNEELC